MASYPPAVQMSSWLQLFQWIMQPLDYLEARQQQYGDTFAAELGKFRNFVFLSDPKAIEQLFSANPDYFEVGGASQILRPTLGDNSVLVLDGDRHQRQRQLLMPPFHGERMKAYSQIIPQITQQVTQSWRVGDRLTMRPAMQAISLGIILQAVFGLSQGERCDAICTLMGDLLDLTTSRLGFTMALFPSLQRDLGSWSPGGRFLRLRQRIDDQIYAEIRERRSHPDASRTDILSLLMAARDDAGQSMTDEELRDELMTLLLAGHETTATALSWALYWIHRLPEVKAQVMAELLPLTDLTDATTITRLPYLNAVCLETLRIYPVVFTSPPRLVKQPIKILDYEFPPDTLLSASIYLTHHREDLYPDSKQFKPARFLERQFSPYEFFPFGGSNRRCIGAAFALFEMKLVLAFVLRHYELELADLRPIKPIRRGVTMAPNGGVTMRVVKVTL